jgi:hypothetical protein
MIQVQEHPDSNIIEITVSGSVTAQEFDDTLATLNSAIERHGSIRVLEAIGELDTPPIPWSKLWEDVKFGFGHLGDLTRVAVVADQGWIAAFVNMLSPLMKAEVKHFKHAERDLALDWLRACEETPLHPAGRPGEVKWRIESG